MRARRWKRLEFLVVQEILPSETTPYADVILPGVAFAEKDGTFTNTERRVQLVRKALDSPGQARPDWEILAELGKRIQARLGGPAEGAAYAGGTMPTPRQIFQEIAALTPELCRDLV